MTILITKLILFISSIFGKGSSTPGMIAYKLDKNILKKFKLPKNIIAVTGSSGKGTTSKMIASTLTSLGYTVTHNKRGGNLTGGIITMLIENCNLKKEINTDYLVYEIDERYVKKIFPYLKPQTVVITNLVRDQPPRQGHTDYVYEDIKGSINKNMHLILNSDDPYIQKFVIDTKCDVTYYGISRNKYSYDENKYENLILEYCPKCNTKLEYNYYHFEMYGDYKCPNCGFKREKPIYEVTNINYDNNIMELNNKYQINILNNILYNVYNIASTIATLGYLGFDLDKIIPLIGKSQYDKKLCNTFKYNDKNIYVFYNKNENSTSFNQSINYITRNKEDKTIVIGWETISHRYKYNDISWIYDIYFEDLHNCNVKKVICVGPNCYDIATRLKLAKFNNIETYSKFKENLDNILNENNDIYFIVNPDYVIPLLNIMKGYKK